MNIKLDASEVTKWINNQPNRNRAIRKFLEITGDKLKSEVQTEAKKISATNQLTNSISYNVTENRVDLYSAEYGGIALESGRKAGKMPPTQALERWAELKLGNSALAFPIAQQIARAGTKKYRSGGPKQLTEVEKRMLKVLNTPADNLLEAMTE
jgi:hypothetical protein